MARWLERLLFGAAILLLAYCGFALSDAWLFQRVGERELARLTAEPSDSGVTPAAPPAKAKPETMPGLIGRLEVTRLGVSAIVIEGVSDANLRHAVGHIPGTALPGEPGNSGIAGHRDSFFRPLQNIRLNDIVTVGTMNGELRYRVVSTRIVSPDETSVLEGGQDEVLTLVTCYPFYYVGAAPERFIVRAQRVI